MPDDRFGEDVAATYDEGLGPLGEPDAIEPVVARLAALAGERPALELAIGTGRIALPLARRGVAVDGVELSTAMLARLRAKPGGGGIGVTVGDMASAVAPRGAGAYGLVYLVFNTIMNLTTQDAQVACFESAARHLAPGGAFVVEVMVPQLRSLPPGQHLHPFASEDGYIGIDVYDVVDQGLVSRHLTREADGWRVADVPFRYVWPAELDLMARIAGLRRRERHGGWLGEPFTAESTAHVSVWTAPGA